MPRILKKYKATMMESNPMVAALNGHLFMATDKEVVAIEDKYSDGTTWFRFLIDGIKVFSCNPEYARANFNLKKMK